MLRYPVEIIPDDNGTFLVVFPDIPEAASVGETIELALAQAEEGLALALEFYFDNRRAIPLPSQATSEQYYVPLSALRSMKVLLLNEMVQQNIRKSEMARRLDVHPPQIDRLLSFRYPSKIDFIEKAFNKLGKNLELHLS